VISAGRHPSFRVHHRLRVILVDIAPQCLRVADEVHGGILLQHFMETLDTHVVGIVLEVHQDGHVVVSGDLRHQLHGLRIAIDMKSLFADSDRSHLEILLDHCLGFRDIRQFVSEENALFRMSVRERHHRVVAAATPVEPVLRSGRQHHRFGHPAIALMAV
jgi:hypothetical protein